MWQRGPWLLVDRATGRVTALRLPDYDPGVSQVSWFRDYAAYCGLTASGKSLYAVVAQVAARKPVLAKKLAAFDAGNHPDPVCAAPDWQREPLRITFHPAGRMRSATTSFPARRCWSKTPVTKKSPRRIAGKVAGQRVGQVSESADQRTVTVWNLSTNFCARLRPRMGTCARGNSWCAHGFAWV